MTISDPKVIDSSASMTKEQQTLNDALFVSIDHFDIVEAKRLLNAGADANATSVLSASLLNKAISNNNFESVSLLMEYGADPNYPKGKIRVKGDFISSPFRFACSLRSTNIVVAMLESTGPIKVDLLERDAEGSTAAMLIVGTLPVSVMEKAQNCFEANVLSKEENKEILDKSHLWLSTDDLGNNAFMHSFSVKKKQWLIDQNFIDTQELVNTVNHIGRTALWYAVESVHPSLVNFLLGLNARVDIYDSTGLSLLKMAEKINHKPILGQLLAVDASQKAMAAIDEIVGNHKVARL